MRDSLREWGDAVRPIRKQRWEGTAKGATAGCKWLLPFSRSVKSIESGLRLVRHDFAQDGTCLPYCFAARRARILPMNTKRGELRGAARMVSLPGREARCLIPWRRLFHPALFILVSRATSSPESKRAEPFGPAHLKENAFEPVCPPGGQGSGLRYLTLS